MKPREPWLAVNLSLIIPGLGHYYCGAKARAVFYLLVITLTLGGALTFGWAPSGSPLVALVLLLVGVPLLLISVMDAHRCARRMNSPEFEEQRKSAPDGWLAFFWTRVFPGLGHFVLRKYRGAVIVLAAFMGVVVLMPDGPVLQLLLLAISATAATHALVTAGMRRPVSLLTVAAIVAGIFITVPVAFLVRAQAVHAFRLPSAGMAPTLQAGDYVFVEKVGKRIPERGDLIAFQSPKDDTAWIKRCVAVAGDTLVLEGKSLYLNGAIQDEPHVRYLRSDTRVRFGPVVVPEDHFFALGDNRDNSMDSRFLGPISNTRVIGRAYKIYWPFSRMGPVH